MMTLFKRTVATLCVFTLCFMGSLSFMPKSFSLASPSVDVQPFFLSMPQLPDGYFDGDILANGDSYTLSLDFSNLSSSLDGDIESSGMDRYTITLPSYSLTDDYFAFEGSEEYHYFGYSSSNNGGTGWVGGSGVDDEIIYNGTADFDISASPDGTGTLQQVAEGDDSVSLYNDYSGTVTGSASVSKDTSDHKRFRCFSCVTSSHYFWFLIDARCQVYSRVYTDGTARFRVYTSPAYTNFRLQFDHTGHLISSVSFTNYNLFGSIASGIWLSPSCPPPTEFSDLTYLRPAVFGDETLLFQYLNTIHSDLNTIHSDLTSLTSSMQSAISGQTSSLLGATATPASQPSTSQMSNYFMQESAFHAPNTDSLFSGQLSSAPMWSGVTWWSSKFNDLFIANNTLVAFFTTMLTLGLAVFIIGRRVNTK